jgi:hypothetical protein
VGERQDHDNNGGVRERVTIREAATLLGVHPNTIRNRVKAGMYDAGKVVTERGETWMIARDSLTINTPTHAPQQLVSRVPEEALTALAREIVKEAGLERDPKQEAWADGEKLHHETVKTQALITAGLLGASGVAWFIPAPKYTFLLILAFLLATSSLGFALTHMYFVALDVRAGKSPQEAIIRHRMTTDRFSSLLLLFSVALLGSYVALNA